MFNFFNSNYCRRCRNNYSCCNTCNNFNSYNTCNDCCYENDCCDRPMPPMPPVVPQARPFLTSYIEALGGTQNVASRANIVFDTNPDELDVVGSDITLDADGSTFRFNRTGLYRVEWSVSITSGTQPIILCLLENGLTSSPTKSVLPTGNVSSGALINVTALPFTLSLHNFGGAIALSDPTGFQNTVASIRISRFGDRPYGLMG